MMPSKPCCLYARPARVDLLHSPGACVRNTAASIAFRSTGVLVSCCLSSLSWQTIVFQSRKTETEAVSRTPRRSVSLVGVWCSPSYHRGE
jgi:hypothetical protein